MLENRKCYLWIKDLRCLYACWGSKCWGSHRSTHLSLLWSQTLKIQDVFCREGEARVMYIDCGWKELYVYICIWWWDVWIKTNQALGDLTIELNNIIAQNEKGCPYRKYPTVLPILSSAGMFCFVLFSSLKHSVFHSWNAQRWCWMLFVIWINWVKTTLCHKLLCFVSLLLLLLLEDLM